MARRTGIDTLFDNEDSMTAEDMRLAGLEADISAIMDDEDLNMAEEGVPGEFGSGTEDDDLSDDEDYMAAISASIENAENYVDSELSPNREEAAKYYRAEKFGNEIEGRSQVVMSEVRDTVLGVMPALLRVFCGNTDAVEFVNSQGTPVDQAQHQTAYINHIIQRDNDGFMIFHSAFKDALIRKDGIITWWHEEKEIVTREEFSGLNEDAYAMLQLEKQEASNEDENLEYEVVVTAQRPDTTAPDESPDLLGEGMPEDDIFGGDPEMAGENPDAPDQMDQRAFIRDGYVLKRTIQKRHRVEAVPPEEFIFSPMASSNWDIFPLVGRRQMKTIGELVAMGHDEDRIRDAVGGQGDSVSSGALGTNSERMDRDRAGAIERIFDNSFADVDEASEYVKYCVVYVLIDRDGDGIIERRKICTVGENNVIIYDEIADEMVPFATLCPDPEPHSPSGYSLADQTMDMQEIKSEMVRGLLDSFAESIFGRTAIVEGQVNIDDALSNNRDQLIRIKQQGAIASISKPFNGQYAMPVLEYLDNVKARRTGITMAPSGLSADTLQSTSTEAVEQVVDASQERAEMIARIFAETGIKRLFRGLLRQVVKHQDQKRWLRIRGKPILVDPRSWNADVDLDVNVGLGRGNAAKRLASLTMILGQQKEVYMTYGPTNPIVTLAHISNTVEDMVRESGFNDVSRYMNVVTPTDADALREEAKNAPKTPTPEEILQQTQREKNETDLAKVREQETTKRIGMSADEDLKRDTLDQQFYLKAAELLGKFGIEANEQEMRRHMEADRSAEKLADDAATTAQAQLQPPQPEGNNQ